MRHPIDPVAAGELRWIAVPAVVVVVLVGVAFSLAPAGDGVGDIVRLELAGSESAANDVIDEWSERDRGNAAFGVGIDYLYLVAYGVLIAAGCIWAGRVLARPGLGTLAAWGAFVAAGLDAIENIGMLNLVRGDVESPWPQLAATCATPKFVLLGLSLGLVVVAGVARVLDRQTRVPQSGR
jgi:hypothetical protein